VSDAALVPVEPLVSGLRAKPANIQSEQALLGAILANNLVYARVAGYLKPADFADPIHQKVYQEIGRRILKGERVDGVSLRSTLGASGVLDEVGGQPYLAQLLAAMVGIQTAEAYGAEVRDCSVRRALIDVASEAVEGAFGADYAHSGEEQVTRLSEALMVIAGSASVETPQVTAGEAARLAMARAEAVRRGDATGAVSSGIGCIDAAIGGLLPASFYLLGGRPGSGKSSLAAQMTVGAARVLQREVETAEPFSGAGGAVLFFSLEMPAEQLGGWMACQVAGVNNERLRDGEFSLEEAEALRVAHRELDRLPIELIDAVGMSGHAIAMKVRAFDAARRRVRLVVVDHLQKIMASSTERDKTAATAKTTSAFKDLARSLNVPVVALAQLSREGDKRDDKRPVLSDLMHAGEADADVVALLYRPEHYLSKAEPEIRFKETEETFQARKEFHRRLLTLWRGKAELIVAKNRSGPETVVRLGFVGPTTSFYELPSGLSNSDDVPF
jgi:replicative DNA helicase